MKKSTFFVCFWILLNQGCSVGPDYKKPAHKPYEKWISGSYEEGSEKNLKQWWTCFQDPILNDWVDRALQNNQNLKVAQARLLEARSEKKVISSALFPHVEGSLSGSRKKIHPLNTKKSTYQNLYDASFDASFELDFFGGRRRQLEASEAQISSEEASYQEVSLSLIGEVVRSYLLLKEQNIRQICLLRQKKAQEEICKLNQALFASGLIRETYLTKENQDLQNLEIQIQELDLHMESTRLKLEILMGDVPGSQGSLLKNASAVLPSLPSDPPLLLAPAEVIRCRPDIQKAERVLAMRTALHGEAISSWYPRVTLSALWGWTQSNLFSRDKVWGIGAQSLVPFLDFGRTQGQIEAASARQKQAFHQYNQTVLEALGDVETRLVTYSRHIEKRKGLEKQLAYQDRIFQLIDSRYKQGIETRQSFLKAQQDVDKIQDQWAQARGEELRSYVSLCKSLGVY